MKKSIILSTVLLAVVDKVYAADVEDLIFLGYKFGKTPSELQLLDFIGFILYIGQNLIGIAGFIAIIYMMIGGFTMVMSTGNPDQIQKGKNTLTYSIVGFIVAMAAYLIVATFIKYITGIEFSEIPTSPEGFDTLDPASM